MKEITVPAITANEDVIKLSKVLVKENEYCKKNKIICSFESSKTSLDLEIDSDGYILIFTPEGKDVKIGEVIGLISDNKINSSKVNEYKKNNNNSQVLTITKKAEILIKEHKLDPKEIKKIGIIRSEDVESFINKKRFIDSSINEDQQYVDFEKIMKSFNYKNSSLKEIAKLKDTLSLAQKIYQKKWKRFIPSIDTIFDRWSSADNIGFEKGSNVSQLSYIIGEVKVGKNCFIGPFTVLDGSAGITIGDNTSIAAGVHVYSHDTVSRNLGGKKFELSLGSSEIGSNCFIGPNAVITRGVKVGNNCFVGPNSVLTFNIPDFTAVTGNPAKIIGKVSLGENQISIKKTKN